MREPAEDILTITGHVSVEDKAGCDYRYLPFEVPEGTERIDVQYGHTRADFGSGEHNIVDIGIFAPGTNGPEQGDFRGWSGGARDQFFVATGSATPGYLPGPMPAGRWHIVLGLYRIAATGCDYTVRIGLSRDGHTGGADENASAPVRGRPAVAGSRPGGVRGESAERKDHRENLRWYVGDLQSHTEHSDARATVAEIARVAKLRGLDFLAVTDHNTTSHHADLDTSTSGDMLLLPGMELTTYYGHANIWGLSRWVDFRCAEPSDIPARVKDAHGQQALFSVNHPFSDCPWTYGWTTGIDAIEVWQGLWNRGNLQAVAWWDELLCKGHRITGVGGSDRHEPADYDPHFPHQVGTPATRVSAESLSTDAILAGITAGRVVIAAEPAGPWMQLEVVSSDGDSAVVGETMRVTPGEELRVRCTVSGAIGHTVELVSGGRVVRRTTIDSQEVRFPFVAPRTGGGYVRAQILEGPVDLSRPTEQYPLFLALTNPVYLQVGETREGEGRGEQ